MSMSILDSRPVQMNVRMDRQLKDAGDAVLAQIGMTRRKPFGHFGSIWSLTDICPRRETRRLQFLTEWSPGAWSQGPRKAAISFAIRASNTASPS